MKILRKDKWATYGERILAGRVEAFCRAFGHGRTAQKGLRVQVFSCARCHAPQRIGEDLP